MKLSWYLTHSELVIRVLIEGAIGSAVIAAVGFMLSRFTRDSAGRAFLVILQFTAAGAYFGFAVVGQAGPLWLLIELGHIICLASWVCSACEDQYIGLRPGGLCILFGT